MKLFALTLCCLALACAVPENEIAAWGDSLTAGAGSRFTSYPRELSHLLHRPVYHGGKGGETSTQIVDRLEHHPERRGELTIIWAGRNNYTDTKRVEADIASAVSYLTTPHFLILSVLNGDYGAKEYRGGAGYDAITRLNADLRSRYRDHFVDVRSVLVSDYDSTNLIDVADHLHDVPPASLRYDRIHLNARGYRIVAQTVADVIEQRGW